MGNSIISSVYFKKQPTDNNKKRQFMHYKNHGSGVETVNILK